jgi:pimeloyl-ACP methyl ester carboxylesterase
VSISTELGDRRTVDLPQGTIAYRERGEGPPIVFVHGVWVSGDHWRKVVPLLADRYRCVAPDLPLGAHEIPMRADADLTPPGTARLIADFIAALDLRDVTVVANDTGDAFAQLLVTDHPDRIARVVLTPGDAFTNFLPWSIKPARVLGFAPPLLKLAARGWQTRLGRFAILAAIARNFPPREVLDSYSRPAVENDGVRRDLQKFFRHAKPGHTLRAARKLRELRMPALIVWTKVPSPIFPKAHGRRLAKLIPGARLEEVGGTLAFVSEDQPERLAELIGEFVPRHASRAAAA